MRYLLFLLFLIASLCVKASMPADSLTLFKADNPLIQYIGRVDVSNPLRPRMWSPGVYIKLRFKGTKCRLFINDEVMYGKSHNYLEIAVDDHKPYRIQTTEKTNVIDVSAGLNRGIHTLLICKDTESMIGFIDFLGVLCQKLLAPQKTAHKIEYIGDSITSGAGMDQSIIPCDKGQWYDQHNAYMSYGPATSRNLHADWQLTSVAGIGLVHSCCNMNVVMPQVYDKVYLRNDSISWDFNRYQPNVITICLGQNDGVQDSATYCNAYLKFIGLLRAKYPKADIVCLTSPMADSTLTGALQRYLKSIVVHANAKGDKKVSKYFFSRRYYHGCGTHPDLEEHQQIAAELTAYLKQLKGW